MGHPGEHLCQPGPIIECPGQRLGLAQQREAPPILSQEVQRASQGEAEIDAQPHGVSGLGQVCEGLEGLLEGGHSLAEGGAVVGPGARLLAVSDGLVPHLAAQGMMRQTFDLVRVLPSGRVLPPGGRPGPLRPRHHLSTPVGCQRLNGLDQARVQPPAPLQQEAAIGHLVRQGMLEGVFRLGEQAGLIKKLRRLQVRQAAMQRRLGHIGNGSQQREGHVRAQHRSGLQQLLLLRR
jgi:hypothetical protein